MLQMLIKRWLVSYKYKILSRFYLIQLMPTENHQFTSNPWKPDSGKCPDNNTAHFYLPIFCHTHHHHHHKATIPYIAKKSHHCQYKFSYLIHWRFLQKKKKKKIFTFNKKATKTKVMRSCSKSSDISVECMHKKKTEILWHWQTYF